MASPKLATYAIYRGDELLDVGTRTELAERRGVKPDTISYYATPAYLRRRVHEERSLYVVRVDGTPE